MPDFTQEQLEKIRFCLDNWDRIEFFKRKHLFEWKNGSITVNYKPTGQIQNVQYYENDNECEKAPKNLLTDIPIDQVPVSAVRVTYSKLTQCRPKSSYPQI